MNKIKVMVVFGAFVFLSACSPIYETEPVGIGPDYSELKKSPCACLQIEMKQGLPEWLLS